MKNPTISQTYGLLARVLARLAGLNLVFLALMTVFRGVFFLVYGSGGGAAGMGWYVPAAFWMGLRFDLSVLCYLLALVLPLLLALPLAAPRLDGRRVTAWGAAGARWYTVITFCLVSGVLAADIGYYSYFQDHINILVFGVYEDDTWALARTVAKNYNLFVIFPLAATYCWGIHRISRRFLGGMASATG
ncbi:MAG: hypothetical protein OEW12_09280, partial [Deltaproteobacteria bacterium]|nr:hypothetical protein [Deltaproteobacteria bacterium]